MKKYIILSALFILCTATYAQNSSKTVRVEPGVSLPLATYRAQVISDIQYKLVFNISNDQKIAISGTENVSFSLKTVDQPLQLDFKPAAESSHKVTVNGKKAVVEFKDEHIIIPAKYLHTGNNSIHLEFVPAPSSLNINTEYLYALFVPDHARTVFPCFDQPDLKARFQLSMSVPTGWKVQSNGLKRDSVESRTGVTYNFANSDKLPTYLFSFTAGEYKSVKQMLGKREAEFLHRETDEKKIKFSTDSIFIAHQNAINFLEDWTALPFPFQKVGFVAIPDFQFGGMEHPGEVQYKASSLFLDEGATKDQFIGRANLISHEAAHMWFGDLVTMRWFNDVWMKEVFANFMADKVTEKMMGTETFNLKFLQDHYPAAYAVDRTQGANPIRQQLDNLQEAGSMYGNIIYHKAPIMMRQLELLMGKESFQAGIREYLKKYAYGNATWPDLIAILSKHTKFNLYKWNKIWVNQPGRPVLNYTVNYDGSKINSFSITQTPEYGVNRIWPQAFEITLVYANHSQSIPVNMNNAKVVLKQIEGMERPLFILFNSNGMGYGLFPADKDAKLQWYNIENPLQRASTYIAAYENMLAARYFKPDELLNLFSKGLTLETNEMNLRLINGYLSNIYWNFTAPAIRTALAAKLEQAVWDAMQQQTAANNKKILFKTYQDIALTTDAKANIYNIWQKQQAPTGIKLAEDDYTSMALSIVLKSDTATSVIRQQQARITNADRKKRLDFLTPALSLDVKERDAFFNSLHNHNNRQKEAWVTAGLSYLNHPLRQNTSIKYLPESLNMVEDIQKTGDIFFPQSWLGSVFGSYQSKEAAQIVRDFIKAHPNYNPKLKGKILQAADNVFRAEKLVQ